MLIEINDAHLKMKVITRSIKTPYCENAQGEEIWEAVGKENGQMGMVLRHSFKIHFHSRPRMVAGKIESA